MTDQNSASTSNQSGGTSAPASTTNSQSSRTALENPRARGYRPDQAQQRTPDGQGQQSQQGEQQQGAQPQMIRVGDVEYSADDVNSAMAHRIEAEARKAALPKAPGDYQATLPADFEAPAGIKFEFDLQDPALARAREVAFKRGVDPETFADMLGVYAATKIAEQQRSHALIQANREKLGSAGDARLNAIETWMSARVGGKAKPFLAGLKAFPTVETVEAMESLIHQFSGQGGANFTQSGRSEDPPKPNIPSMRSGASYSVVRSAQDAARPLSPPRASGR